VLIGTPGRLDDVMKRLGTALDTRKLEVLVSLWYSLFSFLCGCAAVGGGADMPCACGKTDCLGPGWQPSSLLVATCSSAHLSGWTTL
jgi:hypothetical protein